MTPERPETPSHQVTAKVQVFRLNRFAIVSHTPHYLHVEYTKLPTYPLNPVDDVLRSQNSSDSTDVIRRNRRFFDSSRKLKVRGVTFECLESAYACAGTAASLCSHTPWLTIPIYLRDLTSTFCSHCRLSHLDSQCHHNHLCLIRCDVN